MLDEPGLAQPMLVAPLATAAQAVVLAARRPSGIGRLVLLIRFCRPTPGRPMPGLRLATVRGGGVLRRLTVSLLIRALRRQIIRGVLAPNRPLPWLHDVPVTHAANPRAIQATADEPDSFNPGMTRLQDGLFLGLQNRRRTGLPTRLPNQTGTCRGCVNAPPIFNR